MAPAADLLTIGHVARSARLTVRALRHYDDVGVLRPAHIDPSSGYRYYTPSQVRDAIAIAVMRDLGVPLPQIARALAGDDGLAEVLAGEAARIEQDIARSQRSLAAVRRILAHGELVPADDVVAVVDEPDRHVLSVTGEIDADTMIADASALVDELLQLAAARAVISGPVFVDYPVDLTGAFRVAACIEADPSVATGTLTGGSMATVEHVGPYETIPIAYASLFAWAIEHDVRLDDTVRETYVEGPDAGDGPRTLVQARIVG